MLPECEFDEVVIFDLPAEHADRLFLRLRQTRLTWLHHTEEGPGVAVALRVELDDLARLLRDVQAWLAEIGLPYVTFLLDGREYQLREPEEALDPQNRVERYRPLSSS